MVEINHNSTKLIDNFINALWLESGLSENTQRSYKSDLVLFSQWLDKHNNSLATASRGDVLGFLAMRVGQGLKPRTTARLLSSLKRFYRYLVVESIRKNHSNLCIICTTVLII